MRENFASGLRVGFYGNYAIYYLHNEHELVIVRVVAWRAGTFPPRQSAAAFLMRKRWDTVGSASKPRGFARGALLTILSVRRRWGD